MHPLNIYLVGGAVRDKLLGIEVKDRDWVVVGSRAETMIAEGFKQVGSDFPVFLHPKTAEEYALARTERKNGKGYQGFECNSSEAVTLEEDLRRRDLTINAMAESSSGQLIDPYHGRDDINSRTLRHVSPAFSEDPLRVLRLARFAARLAPLNFSIAKETLQLCQDVVSSDELEQLSPERVWQETQQALSTQTPDVFFQVLRDVGALKRLFPEIDALFGVPQPEKHHPEIDCGIHALMSLTQASELSTSIPVRFSALIHDLGKATTPPNEWPRHIGHEKKGLKPIGALCKRLRAPKEVKDLALLCAEFHTHIHKAYELRSDTALKVLKRCDAFRRPKRFEEILICSKADARGRTGLEHSEYPQADLFRRYLSAAQTVDVKTLVASGYQGAELGEKIDQTRVAAIQLVKQAAS